MSHSSSNYVENAEGTVATGGFFIANERNRPFVENQTNRLPSRQKWVWAPILTILVLILLIAIVPMLTITNFRALQQSGIAMSGTVTDKSDDHTSGKNSVWFYTISYQFTAAGAAGNGIPQVYKASEEVYSSTYDHYSVGSPIGILYAAGNSANNIIASDSINYDRAMQNVAVDMGLIICCLLFLFVLWRRMVRWGQLGRSGKLITGTVTDAGTRSMGRQKAQYLSYAFVDPENRTYDRTFTPLRSFKVTPAPGMTVSVVFLDSNNFALM